MAELFTILKVTVGDKKLTARLLVSPSAPLRTSEDIEATARVYYLAPAIAEHTCLGDRGSKFQDCMGDTEVAHLLEHLTVEIMNRTGLAGSVVSGRTHGVDVDDRLFDVELSCPDDVLTIGALSSAAFMMQWAFLYADQTPPDFDGTVAALRNMVLSLRGQEGIVAPEPKPVEELAPEDFEEVEEVEDFDGFDEPALAENQEPIGFIDTEGAVVERAPVAEGASFGGAAGN